LLVVLAGKEAYSKNLTNLLRGVKAKLVEVFSVGIGEFFDYDTEDLDIIASEPLEIHSLISSYNNTKSNTNSIVKKLMKHSYSFVFRKKNKGKNTKQPLAQQGEQTNKKHQSTSKQPKESSRHGELNSYASSASNKITDSPIELFNELEESLEEASNSSASVKAANNTTLTQSGIESENESVKESESQGEAEAESKESGKKLASDKRPTRVTFMLDMSANVNPTDHKQAIIQLVSNITNQLTKKSHIKDISLVSFGEYINIHQPFGTGKRWKSKLEEAFKEIKYIGANCLASKSIGEVARKVLTFGNMEQSMHNQLVVVLAGKADDARNLSSVTREFKAKMVEMFAVGIGEHFDTKSDLETIASEPLTYHTFESSYKNIEKLPDNILQSLMRQAYTFVYRKKSKAKVTVLSSKIPGAANTKSTSGHGSKGSSNFDEVYADNSESKIINDGNTKSNVTKSEAHHENHFISFSTTGTPSSASANSTASASRKTKLKKLFDKENTDFVDLTDTGVTNPTKTTNNSSLTNKEFDEFSDLNKLFDDAHPTTKLNDEFNSEFTDLFPKNKTKLDKEISKLESEFDDSKYSSAVDSVSLNKTAKSVGSKLNNKFSLKNTVNKAKKNVNKKIKRMHHLKEKSKQRSQSIGATNSNSSVNQLAALRHKRPINKQLVNATTNKIRENQSNNMYLRDVAIQGSPDINEQTVEIAKDPAN